MKKYIRIMAMLLVLTMIVTGCGPVGNGENSEMNSQQDNVDGSGNIGDLEGSEESENVKSTEDATLNQTEENTETEIKLYAKANVNVRSLPSTEAEKIGSLSVNQEVVALGEAVDGWQKIRYNDTMAYVSAEYLDKMKFETQITEPQKQVDEITAADLKVPEGLDPNEIIVVIDPGHQGKGNSNKEPDGPGSSTMKAKVSSGATGCVTKQLEYVLNLVVSLKLRDELESRGYQVVMIRETHAINISNSERAKFANDLGADAFIRIHANSSNNSSVSGVETICQTASNPYNANLYQKCRELSDCILDGFIESTGAKRRHVWETDTMSGINWCQVPVTILEMGFLSNPDEDKLMASEDYQDKMVEGIANGLDKYFGK